MGHVQIPTIDELLRLATEGEVAERVRETGLDGDFSRNFSYDHVAAVVHTWVYNKDMNVRPGLYLEGREPMIFPVDMDETPETLWIRNDNGQTKDGSCSTNLLV